MEKSAFTSTEIHKLFQMTIAPNSLLAAEKAGHIPMAVRTKRGNKEIRHWDISQVPAIGSRYGFLKKPESQRVICVYTAKGGVLKSTFSYTLGRALALNGMRVLLIGLDIQASITDLALRPVAVESLEDVVNYQGLADILLDNVDIESVIHETPLPTLDIIPETTRLSNLEKRIRDMKRREFLFKEKIIKPLKQKYDVVIFDNSPNWNLLIENALTASNVLISPIGCDLGSYQALESNLGNVLDFQKEMKIKWDTTILVPTLLEKNKLSAQIYGSYLNHYAEYVTHNSIRRAVGGQEALTFRQTAMEYNPKSELARDYYEVLKDVWERILKTEK